MTNFCEKHQERYGVGETMCHLCQKELMEDVFNPNLNDHIKQQQEVNRGKYADARMFDYEDKEQAINEITADTIEQTLEFVREKMIPIPEFFLGETDARCEEYRQCVLEAITQLEDSKK